MISDPPLKASPIQISGGGNPTTPTTPTKNVLEPLIFQSECASMLGLLSLFLKTPLTTEALPSLETYDLNNISRFPH